MLSNIALGIPVTLQYAFSAVCFGFVIAVLLTVSRMSKYKLLKFGANIYISVFRGTPLIIQLYVIYFSFKLSNVFYAGVLVFSLNSGAYVAEIIKSGINSVDKWQIEAALALNIPYFYIMKDIVLPQAIRKIIPSLVNEVINLLKESSIISVLGGMDLMGRAKILSQATYDFFTPMISVALCYYILVLILSFLAQLLEKKLKLKYD
ncbi:arginine transport system permease protein ArtQ [Orientia tsutsugamushi str. UT76]|uniref:Putative glutamine transport system permease protein GlnP n=1 Tax=Orientia tsutsugamushi TaxID=784 RepID=A0A2R8F1Y3_ORITS|nr:arginine transport system permease protein ArtQ [Orientia tsutsugamushi str. Kato PP]KJV72482.1 arginine transport system permease protein ArtQ [Orientia tsutsugamushi str. UT76]SPM45440.1 arginine ABC transporter permease [Orientia tsutsugamushi]SPR05337.1 arginine ABC transporter permease [Orientia tsutsugamushi]SPR12130.1 arginine ABC transporter permease [Orientia tsutsugamushi]